MRWVKALIPEYETVKRLPQTAKKLCFHGESPYGLAVFPGFLS